MADLKIQDANQATAANLTDRIPVSQGDLLNKTITVQQIVDNLANVPADVSPLDTDVVYGGKTTTLATIKTTWANIKLFLKTYFDTLYTALTVWQDIKDPTGWINGDAIDVSYNKTNRTITLTGDLSYNWRGVKNTSLVSPWTSDAFTNADGEYFIVSSDGTTFTWSTTPFDYSHIQIAKVSKNAAAGRDFAIRETHGGNTPHTVHKSTHNNIGTWRISGGTPDPATYTVNTATDAANSPGFLAARIADEDNETDIAAWTQGTYTTMRIAAGGIATFDTAATLPFRSSGSYPLINNPSTGAETATVTARFVNVYQILIPATSDADSQKFRTVFLQPQAAFTSLALAQSEDYRALSLGDLAIGSMEFVAFTRITYVTSAADSNTGKCRIATGGISYLTGNRASQVAVSGITTIAATAVTVDASGFNGNLSTSDTNMQLVAQKVDDLVFSSLQTPYNSATGQTGSVWNSNITINPANGLDQTVPIGADATTGISMSITQPADLTKSFKILLKFIRPVGNQRIITFLAGDANITSTTGWLSSGKAIPSSGASKTDWMELYFDATAAKYTPINFLSDIKA